MVKVIMGKRGSGKTKQVIDLVNRAVNEEAGNVVCIEKGQNLRFNIKYSAKLIDISEYPMQLGYESMFSFICGLYSGNYDITHVFIDSLYKITGTDDDAKADEFLDRLARFAEETGVKFTLTISDDIEHATEGIKKYLI
ncbi:MAG TPA: hypothetical protein IAB67_00660 [Candidatus Ventrousia excrementavium]|uniref:Twitching motility protein PilT n=1 Tax=Candidatus Ventrousia excrementavium TaxID=2840961 RepID=A0A9D1LJD4_9CLOT|nr:hypothetical protein [Candidatus Ventrousia excrementavium]